MARRVADLRLAYEAMCGPDPRDPRYVPAPLHGPDLPKRVAVTIDPAGQGVHPQVADGVRRAADALRDAGYTVEEVEPPAVAEAARVWASILFGELREVVMPQIVAHCSAKALRYLGIAFDLVPPLDLTGYMTAFIARGAVARAWSVFQAEWPLVLGPICTQPAAPVRQFEGGADDIAALYESMRLVVAVNLLGLPASAVPVGVAEGLPQGVQVIGPRYREDLCLDAAQAIEDRLGILTPIDPRA
jgi:amidase